MRTAALAINETEFHVCRIRSGYRSVAALARSAGISPGYCAQVARGLIPPPSTRAKLAAALGVPELQLWQAVGGQKTGASAQFGINSVSTDEETASTMKS